MDERQLLAQRYVDGELERDASRTVEAVMRDDAALRAEIERLEGVDQAYAAQRSPRPGDDQVSAVMQALPSALPRRRSSFRAADLLVASTLMLTVWVVYGLLAGMPGLIPLGLVTGISLLVGGLMLVLAEPLRQAETSILSRLLQKQLPSGNADVMVLRLTGLAIIIGAIWYKAQAGL